MLVLAHFETSLARCEAEGGSLAFVEARFGLIAAVFFGSQHWVLPSIEEAIKRLAFRVRKDGLEYTPISGAPRVCCDCLVKAPSVCLGASQGIQSALCSMYYSLERIQAC